MAKKRMNGEGSLRQRSDGRWEYRVTDGYRDDGKLKTISFYGKTQSEVKKKLDEYRKKKAAGIDMSKKYTFAQWADIWFDHHKSMVSATTQEGYSYTLRNLKTQFARRKLSDIKAYDIEQFLMKLVREGKSGSTVAQSRGMLFQIFKMAVANDILMKNPVEHAEKIRRAPPKPKEAFTADEVRRLTEELPQNKIGWSIRLMLATGMRSQELLAL